jgi:leishmanolysin-like peptidase
LGFHDVGWKNPLIHTLALSSPVAEGIELNQHDVLRIQAPRASFLTGRLPHHAHQWNTDPNSAKKLKQAGYMMGLLIFFFPCNCGTSRCAKASVKQCIFQRELPPSLPVNRGFDTSAGFLNSGEDHMSREVGCATARPTF